MVNHNYMCVCGRVRMSVRVILWNTCRPYGPMVNQCQIPSGTHRTVFVSEERWIRVQQCRVHAGYRQDIGLL